MIITAFIGYVLPWGWLISPKYFIYDTLFPFQFTFAGPTSCVPIFDWPPAAWPSYAVHDWARLGTDCKFGGSELYSVLSLRDSSTLGETPLQGGYQSIVECSLLSPLQQEPPISMGGKKETRLTLEEIEILDNQKKENPIIISISVGILLGDAHCENRSKGGEGVLFGIKIPKRGNARLAIKQTDKHSEWLIWLHDIYSSHGFTSLKKPELKTASLKYTGLNYSYYKFNTYSRPLFGALHHLFYAATKDNLSMTYPIGKDYTKRLDSSLFNYLDALAIAAWIADDGTNRNGSTAFCTDSFSPQCLNILIAIFKENFGIELYKYRHSTYTRLSVARADMPKFASLVKPYLHASMFYKLGDFK